MKQNRRLSLLLSGAATLGALGLSNATASADCVYDNGVYNNNAGYTTCATVNIYPQDNRGNWNDRRDDNFLMPVPYSNQQVWVPRFMGNFVWTRVTDEWGNFAHLDLRDWGHNPPRGIPTVVDIIDYSSYFNGMFMVQGQIRGGNAFC